MTGLAKGRRWQLTLRTLLLITTIIAAYFGGWVSNDWRHRAQPQPAQPIRLAIPPVAAMPIQIQPVTTVWPVENVLPDYLGSPVERGMKADEWETQQRLQRRLRAGELQHPHGWSVDDNHLFDLKTP